MKLMAKKKKEQYNFQSTHPKYWNWVDIEQYLLYTWKNMKKKDDFKDTVMKKLDWNERQYETGINFLRKFLVKK